MNTNFIELLKNKVQNFDSGETDFRLLSKYKELIKDDTYFDFILESNNCGYFYMQSLHIYGYAHAKDFNNIDQVNSILKLEYGEIALNLISFGQDLFGNQFCFCFPDMTIVFFNVETGEKEVVASNFENWINVLYEDLDFLTGINALKVWRNKNIFAFNERLCPKRPFIIGGEFKAHNLYAAAFPAFIRVYANIARQISNLPNGTKVEFVIGGKSK